MVTRSPLNVPCESVAIVPSTVALPHDPEPQFHLIVTVSLPPKPTPEAVVIAPCGPVVNAIFNTGDTVNVVEANVPLVSLPPIGYVPTVATPGIVSESPLKFPLPSAMTVARVVAPGQETTLQFHLMVTVL